jgi:CSLREA domain-containing protein
LKCAHGKRYVESLTLALVLMTLTSLLLLASPRGAFAQTLPKADYRFQNDLKTSVGTAPALTKIGPKSNTFATANVDGSSRKVLRFPQGNGVRLSPTTGVVSNGTYTIVALFELDSVSGFRRIVDFKNGTSDNGLYVQNGNLRFFPSAAGTGAPIAANTYVQVVLTRDASGTVIGYVDGAQQFSFSDASGDAVIGVNNALRFFMDNQSGGATGEHSGGSVARIRLYDAALSAAEVGELDRAEPTVFTVNSTADGPDNLLQDGKCSTGVQQQCTLRAAVQQSNHTSGDDTINFAPGLSGTISLTQGELSISNEPDSLTINGPKPAPGVRILTVSANNASRVFRVADDAIAAINRLRIIGGNAASNGGGIFNDGDALTLANSTVSGNRASGSGGGIHSNGNSLTLVNSTVSGNTADGSAGILNSGGTMTITNSTVSGNSATFNGGGIFNSGSRTMTLTNSTVTNNAAGGSGGGINNGGTAILRNSIVAGNTASTGPDAVGGFSSQGNNLVGNTSGAVGFGGSDILGRNPLLGPLQDNGGSTDTHALLSRSPAIDKGTNAGCPRTDQRGKTRPMDGDGNGRAVCDIGSYEKKTV